MSNQSIKNFQFEQFDPQNLKGKKSESLYKFEERKGSDFKLSFEQSNDIKTYFSPLFIGSKKVTMEDYDRQLKDYYDQKLADINRELKEYSEKNKALAEALLENSKKEAESLFEQRKNDGYKEGFEHGSTEGFKKSYEEHSGNFDDLKALIQDIANFKNSLLEKYEDKIKNIIIAIVKKIIKRELDRDSNSILLENISYLLHKIVDKEELTIYVSAKDYEFLNKNIDTLKDIFSLENVKILKSEAVAEGSSIIESNYGTYDLGVQTQIDEFENMLK